jgi:ABC-type proline/glycine betaine transport system permease subunit
LYSVDVVQVLLAVIIAIFFGIIIIKSKKTRRYTEKQPASYGKKKD